MKIKNIIKSFTDKKVKFYTLILISLNIIYLLFYCDIWRNPLLEILTVLSILTVITFISFTYGNQKKIKKLSVPSIFSVKKLKLDIILLFIVFSVSFIFFQLGSHNLGRFMTVDEPKWMDIRVPQLKEALEEKDPSLTYINDKPGFLPSMLSLPVYYTEHNNFRSFNYEKGIEDFLVYWRTPILIFNAINLLLIYVLLRKLFQRRTFALIVIVLIGFNPTIIGISQVVNPDSTLWSTSFISILTFMIYIKYNSVKYLALSCIFLCLALLSKYFASILFFIYFICILFDFLLDRNYDKVVIFCKRLFHLILYVFICVGMYFLFFPATWLDYSLIYRGIFGAPIYESFYSFVPILLSIVLIFILNSGKSTIINLVKERWVAFLFSMFGGGAGIFFILLLINSIFNFMLFDPEDFISNEYSRGDGLSVKALITSFYIILYVLPPIIFIGWGLTLIGFRKNRFSYDEKLYIYVSVLFIVAFLIGAAIGGYIADPRYQIMLFPLYASLAALGFIQIESILYKRLACSGVILSTLLILLSVNSYFSTYNNFLNFRGKVVTDPWGVGGYEAVQKLNEIKNNEEVRVWVDREGAGTFLKRDQYIFRGEKNPLKEENNVDYLILSNFGERVLKEIKRDPEAEEWGERNILLESPELLDYYHKDPDAKYCVDKWNHNCYRIIKLDNN